MAETLKRDRESNGEKDSCAKKPRLHNRQIKVVILVGGASKGTRFRPISFDHPKPMVPIAGMPLLHHHLNACWNSLRDEGLVEIDLMGFFPSSEFESFCEHATLKMGVPVKYLEEPKGGVGTAGGLVHYQSYLSGGLTLGHRHILLLIHGDVMCNFPFTEMIAAHEARQDNVGTVLCHQVERTTVQNYGCVVEDPKTHELLHYVEKPQVDSPLSNLVNCGVYLFEMGRLFAELSNADSSMDVDEDSNNGLQRSGAKKLMLERDLFPRLAGEGKFYVYPFSGWWMPIKEPTACIKCGDQLMQSQRISKRVDGPFPLVLVPQNNNGPTIVGNVTIHPSAVVHSSAKLGPNVSIGADAVIEAGVRVANSVVLEKAVLQERSCVLDSILCWGVHVGKWARVEGTASVEQGIGGKFGGVCVLGKCVQISDEIVVRGCVVLPHKGLSENIENRIIL